MPTAGRNRLAIGLWHQSPKTSRKAAGVGQITGRSSPRGGSVLLADYHPRVQGSPETSSRRFSISYLAACERKLYKLGLPQASRVIANVARKTTEVPGLWADPIHLQRLPAHEDHGYPTGEALQGMRPEVHTAEPAAPL